MVRKADVAPELRGEGTDNDAEESVFASVADSFYITFIKDGHWKLFLSGIGKTLFITLSSAVLGAALGFALYMLSRKGIGWVNILLEILGRITAGVPAVVLLIIFYYVILGRSSVGGTLVAVIAFMIIFSVSVVSELKTGVGAVSKGQMEGALAVGYSEKQAFYYIILPQAAMHFMPVLKGDLISLIKGTAVVGYIAVADLTRVGDNVRSSSFQAFFPLIAVALIYLLLGRGLAFLVERIQTGIEPKGRSREKLLKGAEIK